MKFINLLVFLVAMSSSFAMATSDIINTVKDSGDSEVCSFSPKDVSFQGQTISLRRNTFLGTEVYSDIVIESGNPILSFGYTNLPSEKVRIMFKVLKDQLIKKITTEMPGKKISAMTTYSRTLTLVSLNEKEIKSSLSLQDENSPNSSLDEREYYSLINFFKSSINQKIKLNCTARSVQK